MHFSGMLNNRFTWVHWSRDPGASALRMHSQKSGLLVVHSGATTLTLAPPYVEGTRPKEQANGTKDQSESDAPTTCRKPVGTRDRRLAGHVPKEHHRGTKAADGARVSWGDVAELPEEEAYALLFPGRGGTTVRRAEFVGDRVLPEQGEPHATPRQV